MPDTRRAAAPARSPNGYLLVDKPVGPSSHSAVQHVRRALGIGGRRGTKAGHAGTLDPFASGLLLVLVGRATRLMPFVVGHDKRYLVDVRFGASSTTDDSAGELTPDPAPAPARASVEAALAQLAASTTQVPPAVSAIHIDGVRAYQRVRRGEVVTVPPRDVRFDLLDLLEWHDAGPGDAGPRAVVDVRCGTGTYMRALARDLGDLVGSAAHCEALRRTEVGEWRLDDAPAPGEATIEHLRDAVELLDELPHLTLADMAAVDDVARGNRLPMPPDLAAAGRIALLAPDGSLAAIAEPTEAGLLQPRTVLVDPPATRVE